jgi:hypothetical protein
MRSRLPAPRTGLRLVPLWKGENSPPGESSRTSANMSEELRPSASSLHRHTVSISKGLNSSVLEIRTEYLQLPYGTGQVPSYFEVCLVYCTVHYDLYSVGHRVHTELQRPLSAYIPSRLVRVGGARPPPFTTFTMSTVQSCTVRMSRYSHPI